MSYGLAHAATPIVPPSGSGFMRGVDTLRALERRDHEVADRAEVVAALLHDHGRQPERAEDAARLAVAVAR